MTIPGEPVEIRTQESAAADGPSFVSATFLPGRAMLLYQLRARVPGHREIDVLASPPLPEGLKRLSGGPDDFAGNASFSLGGAFLLPFVNRIPGRMLRGRREVEAEIAGRPVRLPANWGGKKPGAQQYSMHGLMRTQAASDVRRESTEGGERLQARLAAGDFDGHWLSRTDVDFDFALTPGAFEARVRATNAGEADLPMAIGWHPYFRIPSGQRRRARLRLPGRERLLVDNYDDVLPTGQVVPVEGSPYDYELAGGYELGAHYLDDCFTSLERSAAGEAIAELIDPAWDYGVRVAGCSPEIIAFQVYAPLDRPVVAIEPQTAFADPYGAEWRGRDTGMALLKPGQSLDYHVRVELFRP